VRKILYGVSPVGLGHATRSLVLVEELGRRGAEVVLFSGGKTADFIGSSGAQVEDLVDGAVPRVVNGEMSRVALWYIRAWLAHRRNVRRARRMIDSCSPDLVVCDEEFSGLAAAEQRSIKRVFISDELTLGFARSWAARRIERRVERWYRRLQETVDLLIVPEEGEDHGNRRYVGPIVRRTTMSCGEVRRKYGLPEGTMVLFSMSGSGIGRELGERVAEATAALRTDGAFLVIGGNLGDRFRGNRVFDLGVVADNQNLVACADLVVSTAGKSTIDEASASGTPIITIPIRHHAEQERNAGALGYEYADIERLPELIRQKIGRRESPRVYRGAEKASELILSV
jgi:UDP-N-acetylglucosamine--N-acetylmuramyl-(pentapeptide) pyrophosphoryl-undecaprenol N-acetylglucosamine transferase